MSSIQTFAGLLLPEPGRQDVELYMLTIMKFWNLRFHFATVFISVTVLAGSSNQK